MTYALDDEHGLEQPCPPDSEPRRPIRLRPLPRPDKRDNPTDHEDANWIFEWSVGLAPA